MLFRLGKIDLAVQVLIGFGAGIAVGLFLGELASPLSVVGTAFIRLLQITVIPYIIVALITGLGRLDLAEIGRLAKSGGSVLLLLWALGILLILAMPLSYPDWPQRSLFQKSSLEAGTSIDFLLLFIPSNPFHAMANAIVPAVAVFSIFIGLALTTTPRRDAIIEPLVVLGEVLTKITSMISRLSPIGVFALVGGMAGTIEVQDLYRLQVYVVVLALVVLVAAFWLVPALVVSATPLGHREMLRAIRAPMITAFATGSSLVVLPMLADACKQLIDKHTDPQTTKSESENAKEEVRSSVDVLIPTFFSFPTIGSILALSFVIFGGWYVGSPLEASQYFSVIFGGLPSLFGGTAIAIPMALDLVDLPERLFTVFLSVDFIGIRLVTLLSVAHYAAIALIGTFALQGKMRIKPAILARSLLPGIAVILAMLVGLRLIYSHYIVVPYTADDVLAQARLIDAKSASTIHFDPLDEALPGAPRTYSQIVQSGTIQICYLTNNYPLSFLNKDGQLVGFDIEMAHRFANQARLSLVLLPLESLSSAADKLDAGYCDAVFNSTTIDLERTEAIAQTTPISLGTLALIVPEGNRKEFGSWDSLRQRGKVRIAQSAFHSLPNSTVSNLPWIEFVPLNTFEQQRTFFENDGKGADAFMDTAEEGAAWTLLYPRFAVIVPEPIVRVPVVYLAARNNPLVLEALNTWLLVERETGGIGQLEAYWIEGKQDAVALPRWSVIRDLLGWIQ